MTKGFYNNGWFATAETAALALRKWGKVIRGAKDGVIAFYSESIWDVSRA